VDILSATLLLIIIMDPLGNIPVFHALLGRYPRDRRLRIIAREMLIAYGVLVVTLVSGGAILAYLGLKQPALSVAGGVVLFMIALRMVFPELGGIARREPDEDEPFIVPLAIPMIAGPSAMAALLLLVSREPERILDWWIAVSLAWVVSAAVLLASGWLMELLGRRALRALVRLSGMLLIMMAVQMFLDGVAAWISSQALPPAGPP
jgi:multiple antibiotic resistance protein